MSIDERQKGEPCGQKIDEEWIPCCPKFDPSTVDENESILLENRSFVRDYTYSIGHFTWDWHGAIDRCCEKLLAANALPDADSFLNLSDPSSAFRTYLYVEALPDREIPGCEIHYISGTFMAKVFEGPCSNCGLFDAQTHKHILAKTGKKPIKVYIRYTACPECAEYYGENYIVLYAQIA